MSRLAIVFCVHHKPWLMQGSLITWASQEPAPADLFFLYNVNGRGTVGNPQVSPFDARVREVCQLRGQHVVEIDYENDDALDSGAWLKFIRDRRWEPYDHVLFAGEGLLFAHQNVLASLLLIAKHRQADWIASGHEKRRLSKATSLVNPGACRTFQVLCRDPEFRALYAGWTWAGTPETEHHVPGLPALQCQIGGTRRWKYPETTGAAVVDGVSFHRVAGQEWFGCGVSHLLSRRLLERLAARWAEYELYDAVATPFAGSALEVMWGFLPAWFGVDKWFTNGFHRPRKDFATYRREDGPTDYVRYVNRYLAARVVVDGVGDYLRIRHGDPASGTIAALPPLYFEGVRSCSRS